MLRLVGIRFGLPAVYDSDELVFTLNGLKLVREHTLNPGWFGHPGTTTIYMMSLIELLVGVIGRATGIFGSTHALTAAIYADPGILLLPGRLAIVAFAIGSVIATYAITARLTDRATALAAAALLAIDPLHITWSQVIRTDVQASFFMLLSVLSAVAVARHGAWRNRLLAAAFLALGIATKWPAVAGLATIVAASVWRWRVLGHNGREEAGRLALTIAALPLFVLIVSPYMLLDYPALLSSVAGEAQPSHLGAEGHGFLGNIGWYVGTPLLGAIGAVGSALSAAGVIALSMRHRLAAALLLPTILAFLVLISSQSIVWARWLVPLLPFVAIVMGVGLITLARAARARLGGAAYWLTAAAGVLLVVPMLVTVARNAAERRADTRGEAAAWIEAHVPPGRSILVEHFAFDLLARGYTILFPIGPTGCVDGGAVTRGQLSFQDVVRWRRGIEVVDLGTVDAAIQPSCRGDYAIVIDYDRYQAEQSRFARELAAYRRLFAGARPLATFTRVPGRVGGPTVRVFRLSLPPVPR